MKEYYLPKNAIFEFEMFLRTEEREKATIEKYLRETGLFFEWLGDRPVTKQNVIEWKEYLQSKGYASVTVNTKLSALNGFFSFMGWETCRVKFLRIQRQIFRQESKELTKEEYDRLLDTACREGKRRLMLLLETICTTGIRVSEVCCITVEAARAGHAEVILKGKVRTVFLPEKLCRKLLTYAREEGEVSGEIFLTRNGTSLSRRQIWREMKMLCEKAGVESSKVFPHNLRHLFATSFYESCKDVVRLADILGHSSVETTRIYLISSGWEHAKQLEQMSLMI